MINLATENKVWLRAVVGLKFIAFNSATAHTLTVVFHAKEDGAINANAHLAHLQAQIHKLMLQLAKEPNFCHHTNE